MPMRKTKAMMNRRRKRERVVLLLARMELKEDLYLKRRMMTMTARHCDQ